MKNKAGFYLLRLGISAVVFAAVCLSFTQAGDIFGTLKIQLVPALDRKAWGIIGGLLILTVLFGRFYCSLLCPFGILQDIISFLSRRKSMPDQNRMKLRYAIAGFAFTALTAGSITALALLDPYSNFGRIVAFVKNPAYVVGGVILAVIIILTVWKKRIFCTSICPVGTVLGLCAKIGLFKMRLSDKCVKCRKCVGVCPSGCIEIESQNLDNERCVRCLKCTAACPVRAVGFMKKPVPEPQKTNLSRRGFLTGTLTTAAAVGAGAVFARHLEIDMKSPDAPRPICPPGAQTPEDFAAKCTNCLLCVSVCEGKVLRPRSGKYEAVHLEYGENHCVYECNRCNTVCPTGALTALTLAEKQKRRIGMAQFFADKCIGCGHCEATCPQGAVELKEINGTYKATLLPQYCIGCGACVAACPAPKKAVRVAPVVIQSIAVKGRKE